MKVYVTVRTHIQPSHTSFICILQIFNFGTRHDTENSEKTLGCKYFLLLFHFVLFCFVFCFVFCWFFVLFCFVFVFLDFFCGFLRLLLFSSTNKTDHHDIAEFRNIVESGYKHHNPFGFFFFFSSVFSTFLSWTLTVHLGFYNI